jgi:hypothetical protein
MLVAPPSLEYGAACWDPCREGQINALERVQKEAASFTNHTKYLNLGSATTTAGYVHFLKSTVGNGLGKICTTGCKGLNI